MKHFYLIVLFLVLNLYTQQVNAQCECSTCDYVITPTSTDFYIYASEIKAALGVTDLAGKKICIQGGATYNKNIVFRELTGSASNPIIITNCGGLVTIDGGTGSPLSVWDSKYVKVLGNGCAQYKYGIRAKGGGNFVELKALSSIRITDLEVAYLNIGGDSGTPGSAGLKIIDDVNCDQDTLPRNHPNKWVIRNILVHDNYIHNVGTEGMYIGKGDEAYGGKPITCGNATKTAYSASLQHVRIYNNVIDYTGWDGLQLKDADLDVKVHNNTITRYGLKVNLAQNEGLYLGSGVVGDVYHNIINTGTGNGFQYFGAGNLNFHNNIIANVGEAGMWALGKYYEVTSSGSYIRILNNTIVKVGKSHDRQEGILWDSYNEIDNMVLQNNIIAGVPGDRAFVRGVPAFNVNNHNYFARDPNDVGFVRFSDASDEEFLNNNDFHLSSTSPAIDSGVNLSATGVDSIAFDLDGKPRNVNNAYDLGVYEYSTNGNNPDPSWAVYINPGGDDFVDGSKTWERDKQTTPHVYYNTAFNSYTTGGTSSFSGTNNTGIPNGILGSYRYTSGNNHTLKYLIPVPQSGATYTVSLYFARKSGDTFTSGARRFDIVAEGETKAAAYDVYDNTGSGAASLTFNAVVHDGILDLTFAGIGTSHAQINAIAVTKYAEPTPDPIDQLSLAINAGGDEIVEEDVTWEKDKQTTPHAFYDATYSSYTTGSASSFWGTNDTEVPNQVMGSYRYTSGTNKTIRYNMPVPVAGSYEVKLFFAKKSADTFTSGARKFNIYLEGALVQSNYDVHDQAGSGVSFLSFPVTVSDGSLEIKFVGTSTGHAHINAMTINGPAAGSAQLSAAAYVEEANAAPSDSDAAISLSPNPAFNFIDLHLPPRGKYHIQVFNEQNELYYDKYVDGSDAEGKQVDISQLRAPKVYIVNIISESGKVTSKRIIKKSK
ncbi:malectin domain-containing carbohydrate-binding protein [Chryseosolibacter indicus]|uniref:Right-handed parallel beta-helix repeat-containing protein n=1 Tax=Chryseosolibacter indicus TaxID=2782351 RepID=A0ABS5VUQ7_9BACT|nr:malectin domain-containing carbohydrate-binding protein [Chryseosolibacter indicus]MBT1703726.1 right-handed parallel beta-helix repeat-containing protein [Chryseosolibacter indicus]